MQYTVPHYFKQFQCIGGACPDTCCAGWQIQIDPSSLRKYRKKKGPLGPRLRNEIDWKEGVFRRYEGRCAFLNEENLCDLYLEGGGEKAFCRTCRMYPRHIEEFEGLREISLSLSCPEAARLILSQQEPVGFLHAENTKQEKPYEEFDFFLFTKLEDSRSLMIQILQNREKPFRLRAAIVLALAHDLQQRIDRNALFETDSLLERYSSPQVWSWFERRLEKAECEKADKNEARRLVIGRFFVILDLMENLRPEWKTILRTAREVLEQNEETEFSNKADSENSVKVRNLDTNFENVFSDKTAEQLMVYFLFTYFCGAVYNRNAYGKVKLCFASTVLIRELTLSEWLRTSGNVSQDFAITAAYRYSREIEHSDYNKCRMEKMLDDEERFGLDMLFAGI
ncbi:MAG TPA: flagellin lysine-N-methylase [Candidatus Mediterraneibacter stercoripullorum]|nr:flagellin lysine-N-methylase [Candidatus Mediterraneibacter stercoripullorum]